MSEISQALCRCLKNTTLIAHQCKEKPETYGSSAQMVLHYGLGLGVVLHSLVCMAHNSSFHRAAHEDGPIQ